MSDQTQTTGNNTIMTTTDVVETDQETQVMTEADEDKILEEKAKQQRAQEEALSTEKKPKPKARNRKGRYTSVSKKIAEDKKKAQEETKTFTRDNQRIYIPEHPGLSHTLRHTRGMGDDKRPSKYTDEQLLAALFYIEDVLSRAVVPFVVLGQVAKDLHERRLSLTGKYIKVAVMERYLNVHNQVTLKQMVPDWVDDELPELKERETWVTEHHEVPIIVRVIHKNYKVFNNPDRVMYHTGEFYVPNPFKNYWRYYKFLR